MHLGRWRKAIIFVSHASPRSARDYLSMLKLCEENGFNFGITLRINFVAHMLIQLYSTGLFNRERVDRRYHYSPTREAIEIRDAIIREHRMGYIIWNRDLPSLRILTRPFLQNTRTRRCIQRRIRQATRTETQQTPITLINFPTYALAITYATKRANKLQELQNNHQNS